MSTEDPRPAASTPHSGRFVVNVAANTANFLVQVGLGLFMTPYLIRHLGWGAYGLVPLVNTLTNYLNLGTVAVNAAVGRFLTIAVEQKRLDYASRLLNTSFWGSVMIVGVLAGPCWWAACHAERLLRVPAGQEMQARWLLAFAIMQTLLSAVATPFDVSTYCRKRFDLRNAVSITANLVGRVLVVIVLFNWLRPQLWQVGAGLLVMGLIGLGGAVINWRRLLPDLHLNWRHFDREVLGHLTQTGGWMVVSQVGTMLLLAIDLLVVNRMFGADRAGQYAAVSQWSAYLRTFSGVVAGVFGPSAMIYFARSDTAGLVLYLRRATKLLGLIVTLPVGLLCGLSEPFLRVWLHRPDVATLAPLMSLITFHLALNLGYQPLHNVSVATNRVRVPGLVQLAAGALNLGLAVLLAGPVGWGVYGVAAAGAIVLTLRNLVFTPLYAAHVLDIRRSVFYLEVLPVLAMVTGLAGAGYGLSRLFDLHSLLALAAAGLGLSLVYLLVAWAVAMTADEREIARTVLLGRRAS